jgi:hypothetical protein
MYVGSVMFSSATSGRHFVPRVRRSTRLDNRLKFSQRVLVTILQSMLMLRAGLAHQSVELFVICVEGGKTTLK